MPVTPIMTPIDLDKQPKPVLLLLLRRYAPIDARDVAYARWELACDETKRLWDRAHDLSVIAAGLYDTLAAKWSQRASAAWHGAEAKARRAHAAAERAQRHEDRCWKALEAFFQKNVK